MSFDYSGSWEEVENTVNDRILDDSLLHTLSIDKKIKKQTKSINQNLRKFYNCRRSYKHFTRLKRQIERSCQGESETEDETSLNLEEYRKKHSEKSKSELQKFLRLCTRTKKHDAQKTKRKSPTLDATKSNKFRTFKCPNHTTVSKRNVSKHRLGSTRTTSGSNVDNLQSKLSQTKSQLSQVKLTSKRKTVLSSNKKDIKRKKNENEEAYIKEIINDLTSDVKKETIDESLESDSKKAELTVGEDNVAENSFSKESAITKLQRDATHRSTNCFELVIKLEVLNENKQDICNLITDFLNDLDASSLTLNCTDISSKNNLPSEEDIFMTDDEKRSLNEISDHQNNVVSYIGNVNHDSGNNSLSETDVLREEHRNGAINKVMVCNYRDREIVTKRCFAINEKKNIPNKNICIIETDEIKPNVTVNTLILDDKLNLPQPQLSSTNYAEEEMPLESNLDSEASQEISFAKPISILQLKSDLIESTIDNDRSKPKITEEKLQLFKCGEISEVCNLSQSELQHCNQSIDHEGSLSSSMSKRKHIGKTIKHEFLPDDEEQSEDIQSSKEDNVSEIPSYLLNRSLNSSFSSLSGRSYDENFKNHLKAQLLSEIEQKLRNCSPSKKYRSSDIEFQSELLDEFSHDEEETSLLISNTNKDDVDDQLINNQILIEDNAQSLECNRSLVESNLSQIEAHTLNRSSHIITDSFGSPKSTLTKRRISSHDKENHCSVESTLQSKKLPRLHKQSTKRQPELISYDCDPQRVISHEFQSTTNRDDSLIGNGQRNACEDVQCTRRPKKRPRPRDLQEFAASEALIQDTTQSHFRLKDVSNDDEIWIMNIPKTINPKDLENQMISLGGKSELRFENNCYKVSSKPSKEVSAFSCILATSRRKRQYKIENFELKGTIKFRQKCSIISATELISSKTAAVPFPKNLKTRHPLFGALYKDKI